MPSSPSSSTTQPSRVRCIRHLLLLTLLTLPLLATGCATTSAPPPPVATTPTVLEQPPEVDPRAKAILWARTSAEHSALYRQIYDHATAALEAVAAGRAPRTWAVALDADETVIDNSLYNVEQGATGYTSESWKAWVARREATPLPGAREFLGRVRELGGVIAIVTNRRLTECPDTEANFEQDELPYDVILCRGEDGSKQPRWDRVEAGTAAPGLPPVEILLWLGDNIHDFPGGSQGLRSAEEDDTESRREEILGLFGERYFIFPNPVYGSWEDNELR